MTEESMISLATPTRFLMENGEWNLTPSLLNEINPFDYRTKETLISQENQQVSDPESDTTSSLSTSPIDSFHQSPTFTGQPLYQPVIQSITKRSTSISSGRKRRIVFEGEDAEEKRKKFLERNRVAAYKCRQKKKNWLQDLEAKANVQTKQNEKLLSLVSQLKEESMYLRNLLLSHGNCECESVQAYIRKTSLEISNNATLSEKNHCFSTGLTPFLDTVINKPPTTQDQQDYFSSFHN